MCIAPFRGFSALVLFLKRKRASANGALAKWPVRHCTRYGFLDGTVYGQDSSVCAFFFWRKADNVSSLSLKMVGFNYTVHNTPFSSSLSRFDGTRTECKFKSGVGYDPNTHVALVTRVALALLVVGRVPSSLLWENRDAVNSPSFNVPES